MKKEDAKAVTAALTETSTPTWFIAIQKGTNRLAARADSYALLLDMLKKTGGYKPNDFTITKLCDEDLTCFLTGRDVLANRLKVNAVLAVDGKGPYMLTPRPKEKPGVVVRFLYWVLSKLAKPETVTTNP